MFPEDLESWLSLALAMCFPLLIIVQLWSRRSSEYFKLHKDFVSRRRAQ
jgi:hypothetical protein